MNYAQRCLQILDWHGVLMIWCAGILFICGCNSTKKNLKDDPVSRSLDYQSWEDTAQPEGSPVYLALGTYAKVLCTAVFESGRSAEEAFKNSGKLILDDAYHDLTNYSVDRKGKSVTVSIGDSVKRSAWYTGDQGCIIDADAGLHFTPVKLGSSLEDPQEMSWPMGDITSENSLEYDRNLLDKAINDAFDPRALTAAFLVVHKGQIILEQYGQGVNYMTQLESWSMGKSLTATLIGRLIQEGYLGMDQKAPVPEWSADGDPRGEITIRDLLQMSSGLRFPAHRDPEVKVPIPLLAHMYIYTKGINVFDFAVNRPLEFIPGTTGRYRNCDPLTLGYIIRRIVESQGRNYHSWPQEELFDKIGIRRQLLETDPFGNFILTGFDYGTARNWARLGLLYLQDGIWDGQRLLPEGFTKFVSTPAPGWDEPIYGGMFWLNGTGAMPLPKTAFYMAGGGGQRTIIVPSMDMVVVRMGHSDGGAFVEESLNQALETLVEVVRDQSQ